MLSAQEVQTIMYNGLPSAADTALQVEWVEGNRARVRYPFKPSMIRPGGTISGPTMMGLADSAMYAVILGRLGALEMAVTQNLNINFLSKPAPVDMIADAEIIRLGRRSAVLEVRLYSVDSDDMVAHVTGIYALPATT
ncbi:PaaI family thioesterase [Alloalcanivorax xenomutans]|uniref:PaaI family thioesterase n=1 Tax=Alloalcanivorax xenomutans TaxID=1094342 RepID=A0A9Q3ZEG3_9GAMM|nr:PaaI family thioesterase [Alloalcanivorax xenomutans]ERS12879.1 thioesterase [Alcanivorax sp. PN-3]MBA4721102.1 PaaI family thioesterase [Alcanivorax sp.]MCE7510660.1 PaaI family thioesterase [Alloalcanivorax xenomutans]MCE7525381.1 PaaI family thioesterase [Alloalcanivorax xenomutans]WOA30304.1 PaaI family thioesterase [Alloalcanivorax xenomutans]